MQSLQASKLSCVSRDLLCCNWMYIRSSEHLLGSLNSTFKIWLKFRKAQKIFCYCLLVFNKKNMELNRMYFSINDKSFPISSSSPFSSQGILSVRVNVFLTYFLIGHKLRKIKFSEYSFIKSWLLHSVFVYV